MAKTPIVKYEPERCEHCTMQITRANQLNKGIAEIVRAVVYAV